MIGSSEGSLGSGAAAAVVAVVAGGADEGVVLGAGVVDGSATPSILTEVVSDGLFAFAFDGLSGGGSLPHAAVARTRSVKTRRKLIWPRYTLAARCTRVAIVKASSA